MNQIILLKNRPDGKPQLSDFEFTKEEKPQPQDGEVLLKSKYVSVDPYLRGRMRDVASYIDPFELNEPLQSNIIAEVVTSNNSNFNEGDFVNGMLKWKEFQVSDGKGLNKVDGDKASLSAYLGILGLTGLTAHISLDKIADLKKGETLLVSGASGAVGSTVGQIGKIKGCRVVGIAGSDEKLTLMKDKFGFDEGINYKTTKNMNEAVAKACPNGVDVYYDNVGGEILDAAMNNINKNGRVINCGAISLYNETGPQTGPRYEGIFVKKTVLMQGFLVRDHVKEFGPATQQLLEWLNDGKLTYSETIVDGFENIPQAFLDLFEGKNKGKMVVQIY
ncbi:NADP-dependent oxidoreductase [Zobellia amurskyensis]|uniref:NADP-dependent oxidoreductase n=1 Tax=Zobellia amurskyensis TaxID=248905 RepID=A0A7X2ZUZ9_9FLAO|nr:NADP-dependent oxidoreductase [Zobellia amurskyensis]MUH36872.1 NADP-dependent oxidoreductase [Zobellia amurskyensis]